MNHTEMLESFIVCEGEREANYFKYFDNTSQKLIINVSAPIDEHKGQSAPNKLEERAIKHIEENGWDENYSDQLWFVLDVDSWKRESINKLFERTLEYSNWNIAISNPCFEVWLYYHKFKEITSLPETPSEMKQLLHKSESGGYTLEKYAPEIRTAIINSKANDKNDSFYPDLGITKVYLLAEEFVSLLIKRDGIISL